jgi:hypothetical protein
MAGFDPRQYDQQSSRFGSGSATTRGTFAQYLGGNGSFGDFAGQMQGTFKPPSSTNAEEEQAFGGQAEASNFDQWDQNLNRVSQQHGQYASLGSGAVSGKQDWIQAKEMASQQASSAKQGAIFGGISSGLGILGGLGSFGGGSLGGAASGSTYSMPSASSWNIGSSQFRYS